MPILKNISQLATCPADNPQGDAGLLEDSVLVWRGEHIEWVGRAADLPTRFHGEAVTDCGGRIVVPGLVDCHTHLSFGGWRGDEFAQRLAGASYQEIAAAGGGIMRTVTATRAATSGDLERTAMRHLAHMLRLGVTTVECKSGYGLDYDTELKQLHVYRALEERQPVSLVATYLGGHVLPREYRQDREGYLRLVCESVLPTVTRNGLAEFCDVFIEEGAFTASEARVILSRAQELGLGLKVHADQLSEGGGAQLAAEMGAISAEHLEYVGPDGVRALAEAGVVAVSLPLASLYLKERYIPARSLIEAGVRVAVATDFNPGSAPSYHLPLAMTLACLNQNMTPAEALMGATAYAARAIGRCERIGSLQAGYRADIAIIDAPDINHWLYHFRDNACTGVIKSGKWVHTRTPAQNLYSD